MLLPPLNIFLENFLFSIRGVVVTVRINLMFRKVWKRPPKTASGMTKTDLAGTKTDLAGTKTDLVFQSVPF